MTLGAWLRAAEDRLVESGIVSARLEAQLLAAASLRLERSALLALDPMTVAPSDTLLNRRLSGEPLAYILGWRDFREHRFLVGPGCLIPRHETEELVELALDLVPSGRTFVADVGSGSGCIGISLAMARPDWCVVAVDLSWGALNWTQKNRAAIGPSNLIGPARTDLLRGFRENVLDVVVSNPPYVSRADPLPSEVAGYEPELALFAEEEGLAVVRRLALEARFAVRPGGHLMIEVGLGQSGAAVGIVESAGWKHVATRRDLAGIERALAFVLP